MQKRARNKFWMIHPGSVLRLLVAASLSLAWYTSAVGETPVTRDDFICCDTSADSLGSPVWPSVALDGAGNIALSYLRQQITDTETALRLFLMRLEPSGALMSPEFRLLPDTLSNDSVCWPTSPANVSSDNLGRFFVPVHSTYIDTARNTFGRGVRYFALDSSGIFPEEPVNAALVPMEGNHFRPHMAVGDMNSSGLSGAAWVGRQIEPPYGTKLFVRLFDVVGEELGSFIVPTSRPSDPHPLGFIEDRRIKGPPAFSIDNGGGFAVAWIANWQGGGRLQYAVYDPSGQPRGRTQFAETGDISAVSLRTVNMAGESDGDFYLVWSCDKLGLSEHYSRTHIWMRGFNADGSPKHDAVRVDDADSTNIVDVQLVYPSIACDDSGNVVIAWADGRLHSDSHPSDLKRDVFLQRVAPDGRPVGGNRRVNNNCGVAGLKGTHSDCDLNNDGQVIVVWREFGEANTIKGQLWPLENVGRDLPGDLNCDLVVDDNDPGVLRDYLLGDSPNTFWPRSQADPNGDRQVDISDLVYLTDFLHNGGESPVVDP
ncbi:MAG: hypothetical protein GY867_10905 [bacterium]|nr:hypothetical protein [bacterium]